MFMNAKLSLLLLGGLLLLGACAEEKAMPLENDSMETVDMTKEQSEEVAKEETVSEEQPMIDAEEAASGKASPLLSKGEKTTFIFNEAGEFAVYCEPHPVMKMKVIVEASSSNSGEVSLDIADYAFSEESITVAPGTVITWTNQDSARHNVAFE